MDICPVRRENNLPSLSPLSNSPFSIIKTVQRIKKYLKLDFSQKTSDAWLATCGYVQCFYYLFVNVISACYQSMNKNHASQEMRSKIFL